MTDFAGLLGALARAEVEFVLIGGVAATVQSMAVVEQLQRAAGR